MGGYHSTTRRTGAHHPKRGSRRLLRRAAVALLTAGLTGSGAVGAHAAYPAADDHEPVTPSSPGAGRDAGREPAEQQPAPQAEPAQAPEPAEPDPAVADAEETAAERDLALASTWHLDPSLLTPLPTDSHTTTEARAQLAEIASRFEQVLERYETARLNAEAAQAVARDAAVGLSHAQAALGEATARYRADRKLFVAVILETYTTDSVGDFGKLLSAETGEDLATGLVALQEMGQSQSSAVIAAEESRDRLRVAAEAVAEAERESRASLVRATLAVTRATDARAEVVSDLRTARALLKDATLADQLALEQERLALERGYDVRELGEITFPLPRSASFVDQENWGAKSEHWSSVHTGDDLSTGCGTPVLAATDGVVEVRTDQSWSGPWLVMVTTGEGKLSTWYAHLETLVAEDGQEVLAGDTIGMVGSEGNSSGCHLHFEVHPQGGGIYEDNVDPVAWLREVDAYPS